MLQSILSLSLLLLAFEARAGTALPVLGTIPPVQLIDQTGAAFDTQTLRGQIAVFDFIFTSCPGPCPLMSQKMASLQRRYHDVPGIKLVSITTDPATDTPTVLTAYGQKYGADPQRWTFLTGDKAAIIAFARDSLKLAAGEDPSMHATRFVVVDAAGQIRAYPDTQDEQVVETTAAAIDSLREASGNAAGRSVISLPQAFILGLVEGVTEYLPISSTGHLVLADELLGLRDTSKLSAEQFDAVEAFEVVIQSGAIIAVIALYGRRIRAMFRGLLGKDPSGLKLLINIAAAFVPTAVVGLLLNKIIKTYLQHTMPVIAALFVGGIVMIVFERSHWAKNARAANRGLDSLTVKMAVAIGFIQCLAMWPGTSRSMVTILGGMMLGLSPVAAAEFSFLLGLPTLLAATGLKGVKEGHVLIQHIGPEAMAVGLFVAAVSAFIAVRSFVAYLSRSGFVPFGIYRIVVAIAMAVLLGT